MSTSKIWQGNSTFILAAAGSAVGLGNIWKFPYMVGSNGGSAFVLIYLICIFAIGLPVMVSEIIIGKYGRKSPVNSLKKISEEGTGLFVLINHRDAKSYWLNKLEEKQIEPKSNRRVIGVGSQILRALNLKKITVLGTPWCS